MYDLIIIGAGVAGMTASIYASRYKIKHLIFGELPGGQGMLASEVENYPGYVSISGSQLMQNFVKQVESYGVKIVPKQIDKLAKINGGFEVVAEGERWQAKSLILAMGASFRHLGTSGEEKFIGRGISYCSVCDAPFFKDKIVAVVGGGDSAVTGALHVASFALKVYIIHRRDQYRAEPTWVERLNQEGKIEQILTNEIKEIKGGKKVEEIVLKNPYQGKKSLKVDGVFIEIGQVPSSSLARQLGVKLDEQGYVLVNPAMATNVPGVFAAGDLSVIPGETFFRQFITAASDGARAAASVYQYLQGKNPSPSWGK